MGLGLESCDSAESHGTRLSPNVTRLSPMRLGLGHSTEVGTRPDSAEPHATQRVKSDSAMNESGPEFGILNLGLLFVDDIMLVDELRDCVMRNLRDSGSIRIQEL